MDLGELKAMLDQVKVKPITREELIKMTRSGNLPRLRRMKTVLIIECVVLLIGVTGALLLTDMLSRRPWMSAAFIGFNALFLFVDMLGYAYMRRLPNAENIRQSAMIFFRRLTTLVTLSRIINVTLGLIAIYVFVFYDQLDQGTYLPWIIMIVIMKLLAWLSSMRWSERLKRVKGTLKSLDEGPDEAQFGQQPV